VSHRISGEARLQTRRMGLQLAAPHHRVCAIVLGALGATLLGALGATLAWIIIEILLRPFRQFFDLRREVARRMVEFGNVMARAQMSENDHHRQPLDISREEEARLCQAEEAFRDLGAQMRAFAIGEWFAAKTVKGLGFDAVKISAALIVYSNEIGTYGQPRRDFDQQVRSLLRLGSDS
jgi:hypothetical protein